jgi:hypothetical protein
MLILQQSSQIEFQIDTEFEAIAANQVIVRTFHGVYAQLNDLYIFTQSHCLGRDK